ncbi:hypothetical protein MHU86_4674 [Fragilaria crotonensis]|nr:hypothetical protein MHU86_4674 [Fragilaria crotonensis]
MTTQLVPNSFGTISTRMEADESTQFHHDYTMPLTGSDDSTADTPFKRVLEESPQRLERLSKRREAASWRSKRLAQSLKSLQSLECGKALDNDDSFDFDDLDDLRDSIHLTKQRFMSARVISDDEDEPKDSVYHTKQLFNPAPTKVEDVNKAMNPLATWKNLASDLLPLAARAKAA